MSNEDTSLILKGRPTIKPLSTESVGVQLFKSLSTEPTNKVALIDGASGRKFTYADILSTAVKLAKCLRKAGFKEDDVLGVSGENCIEYFFPVIAGLFNGIVVAPFNQTYIGNELNHVVNITKPKIIFVTKSVKSKFLQIKERSAWLQYVIVLNDPSDVDSLENFMDKHVSNAHDFEPSMRKPEDTFAVLCSSGTTGMPKGVKLSNQNLSTWFTISQDPQVYEFDPDRVKLAFLPFFHGMGFNDTLCSLMEKNTSVVVNGFSETVFLEAIQNYKITCVMLVPPIAVWLAKSPTVLKYNLKSVKEIVCSAAPLSLEIEEEIKQRIPGVFIRQGYGMTETTLGIVINTLTSSRNGSVGVVTPGIEVKVRCIKTGKLLPANHVGEILARGGLVTPGYYLNDEATKTTIDSDGWISTGDLGYYDEDGFFYIVGRVKELIKYKGFQVPPAEIEAVLLNNKKIKDAAVVGIPHPTAGEFPVGFVVKQPGVDLSEREVKDYVAANLSNPKHLRGGVHFVEAIPKNAAGKIIRKELVEKAISLSRMSKL